MTHIMDIFEVKNIPVGPEQYHSEMGDCLACSQPEIKS